VECGRAGRRGGAAARPAAAPRGAAGDGGAGRGGRAPREHHPVPLHPAGGAGRRQRAAVPLRPLPRAPGFPRGAVLAGAVCVRAAASPPLPVPVQVPGGCAGRPRGQRAGRVPCRACAPAGHGAGAAACPAKWRTAPRSGALQATGGLPGAQPAHLAGFLADEQLRALVRAGQLEFVLWDHLGECDGPPHMRCWQPIVYRRAASPRLPRRLVPDGAAFGRVYADAGCGKEAGRMQSVPRPSHVPNGPHRRPLLPSFLSKDRVMCPLHNRASACLHACALALDAGGTPTRAPPCSHALLEAWGQPRTYLLIADHDEYFVLPTPTATLADALTKCTDDKGQACPGLRCCHLIAENVAVCDVFVEMDHTMYPSP